MVILYKYGLNLLYKHAINIRIVTQVASNKMASTSRQQPKWIAPSPERKARLQVYNSLTRSKVHFIPVDPKDQSVTWYVCGPTVYDDTHLGHARNYVTTDIIRRIMQKYFRYDVKFVMNITDVDDKIILRARQQYLFDKFRETHPTVKDAWDDTKAAFEAYARKNLPDLPSGVALSMFSEAQQEAYGHVLHGEPLAKDGTTPGDREAKLKMHCRTVATAANALAASGASSSTIGVEDFYTKTADVLLPYLDSLHGSSINGDDHSIFTRLTRRYERRFDEDMEALNVARPDIVTRVTEYGPQIVKYVEQIVHNGFGYSTPDGSVYFDIKAFEGAGKPYARLEPWNRNDRALQADGEGALTKSSSKRSDADFALWKSSNPGEPSWPSPWGRGRPGWHIECSTMASDVLGKTIDIHSGGIDLAFPHHDNELAQSEAYWHAQEHQWVNYFLHMGHLSIQGSKMSKSLKNFTTIRSALERGDWTARSLRIVFLMGIWKDGIEITDDMVKAASNWEDKVNNFFLKAKMTERTLAERSEHVVTNGAKHAATSDDALLDAHVNAEKDMQDALSDSFDTPRAMQIISELVTKYNSADKSSLTDETTIVIANWITNVVRIFGLDTRPGGNSMTQEETTGSIGWSGVEIEEAARPFVFAVSELRDELRLRSNRVLASRKVAEKASNDFKAEAERMYAETVKVELSPTTVKELASKHGTSKEQPVESIDYAEILSEFNEDMKTLAASEAQPEKYLDLCDKLRDVRLWSKRIYLEDAAKEGEPAIVRPLDEALILARAEQEKRAQEKEAAKVKRAQEAAKKEAEREAKSKVDPKEMFRTQEFSEWDDDGLPTKDARGNAINKSQSKKLRKQWEAQTKAHGEVTRLAAL